jgi:hypothetical protein
MGLIYQQRVRNAVVQRTNDKPFPYVVKVEPAPLTLKAPDRRKKVHRTLNVSAAYTYDEAGPIHRSTLDGPFRAHAQQSSKKPDPNVRYSTGSPKVTPAGHRCNALSRW